MLQQFLKVRSRNYLPVTVAKASDLIINQQSADKLGVEIPESILERAEVYKK